MGTLPKIALSKNQIQEIDSFSVAMIGNHRNYRSGGQLHRTEHQIFLDDKVGKTAEFILYRFLKLNGLIVSKQPDLHVYPLSEWDAGFDLEVTTSKGKKWRIDVKGSGPNAHNLLLETKDWSLCSDDNKLLKTSSDFVPSFWFAVNVDSDMAGGTIHGYIPQKKMVSAIQDSKSHHTYFQGQNIPGTSTHLDADNYIWRYEELWDPVNFLKYYKNN